MTLPAALLRYRVPLCAAGLALVLAGCGGGGGTAPPLTGQPLNLTRGLPHTVTVAGSPAYRLAGGDDYIMLFSEASRTGGTVTVQLNGGTNEIAPLAGRATSGAGRHVPAAALPPLLSLPSVSSAPPLAHRQSVGQERTFRVLQGSAPYVTAKLRVVGQRCLLYVDRNTPADAFASGDLEDLRTQFDTVIYPKTTGLLGETGDIDANGRVILLLTPTIRDGGYGYFYPGDVIPGYNNDADMLYCLVPQPAKNLPYSKLRSGLLATLAHELAHLINYHYKRPIDGEESWLNEGLSFVNEQYNGYLDSVGGSPENVAAWFRAPERFTARELSGDYKDGHAGLDFLFVRYLADQFGSGALGKLVRSAERGRENIQALTGQPYATTLTNVGAAAYLAGTGLATAATWELPGFDTRANYPVMGVTLNGPRQTKLSAANGRPAGLVPWAGGGLRYLRLTNVPATGVLVALRTSSGPEVRVTFIRVPTSAP